MTEGSFSLHSAAITDVVFLLGLLPESLTPISVAEMHMYAYLANVGALHRGVPISEWGYRFAVTSTGFPFSDSLASATENLIRRSIVSLDERQLSPDGMFDDEREVLESLAQSRRRKEWLEDALMCVLHLPQGAVRHAINRTPGMLVSLRFRRASALLRDKEIEEIYDEFELVHDVLGSDTVDALQPLVVWLSSRVIAHRSA